MITGAHSIIYTKNAKADRDFFKKVLKFPNVDVGQGWLIFGLPPSEVAFHPIYGVSPDFEFYLMCDDIQAFVKEMAKHKIVCSKIKDQSWGKLIEITLPGGGQLGVYQAKHASPAAPKKVSKPKAAVKKKSV